ncbi:MAG: hypothetical protein Q8R42_04075, partial [Desulfocapsaceae bacterium]|nr:hypothetical protein [Desulfocapsaceae bacterium]
NEYFFFHEWQLEDEFLCICVNIFYGQSLVKVNRKEILSRGIMKILSSNEVFGNNNIDCKMTEAV